MRKLLILVAAVLFMTRCVPYEEEVLTEIHMDINDPVLRKIYTFQDEQKKDSLYKFFHHPDPTYRYVSAMAFASIRDSSSLDSLAPLMRDPIEKVRSAAIYAVGQIGHPRGEYLLLQAFDQQDTAGRYKYANAEILEAVGKCSNPEKLKQIATIGTYHPGDTVLLEGQAWGIYRFALREITSPEGTGRMIEFVTNDRFPESVRFIAANYLYRAKGIDLTQAASELVRAFTKERSPRVRIPLAVALGKTKSDLAREAITGLFGAEQDYRVQCNMIRGLANFDYQLVKEPIISALASKNTHVAIVAADYFRNYGNPEDARLYWQLARDTIPWQVQTILYAAAHKYLPPYFEELKGQLNYEIRRRFENSTNQYEKAGLLDALSEFGWNFRYINEKTNISDHPVIRTAGIRALATICNMDNFEQFFGLGARQVKREIAFYLQEGFKNGDPGVIAEAAVLLRSPKMNFKILYDSLTFLDEALSSLELPKEIESYNELKKTIEFLKGLPSSPPRKPEYNHPIDWTLLNKWTESSRASFKTTKGNFTIQFYPFAAPGTVANFLQLVRDSFYNGKFFHRVVPDFVIQGGCPRGDGYGSLDYSIRSELADMHYDSEGWIGMASAGNHTESTQFFITHCPTPHLDGNYTIFAKVTDGLSVIHDMQIGDKIESVTISY